jgi:hypothetical protein
LIQPITSRPPEGVFTNLTKDPPNLGPFHRARPAPQKSIMLKTI